MRKNSLQIILSIFIIFIIALITGVGSQMLSNLFKDREEKQRSEYEYKTETRKKIITDSEQYYYNIYEYIGRPLEFASITELKTGEVISGDISSQWGNAPLWLEQKHMDLMLGDITEYRKNGIADIFSWQNIIFEEICLIKPYNEPLTLEINELEFTAIDTERIKSAKLNIYFALSYYNALEECKILRDNNITEKNLFETYILGKNENGTYPYLSVNKNQFGEKVTEIFIENGYLEPGQQTFDFTNTYTVSKEAFNYFSDEMLELYDTRIKIRYIYETALSAESGDPDAAAVIDAAAALDYGWMTDENALNDNASNLSRIMTRTGKNILIVIDQHYNIILTINEAESASERLELDIKIKKGKNTLLLITVATFLFNLIIMLYFARRLILAHRRLFSTQENFKAGNEYHKYISEHDILTNLSNKEYLKKRFNQLIYDGGQDRRLALIFIDLDNFKEVNDIMGHNVGDILLDKAAQLLRKTCSECEVVSRAGGDEFLVLKQFTDIEEVNELGARITEAFSRPVELINNSFVVTASVGAALYPDNGWDFQEVYKNADTAMYESKQRGRNTFTVYSAEMRKEILNTYDTLNYIRNFEEHLYLEYQPIIWLDTGEVAGFEALSRMKAEDHFIPPSEFVPLAVEHGYIINMGYFALREVCKFIMRMEGLGVDVGFVTVNISAPQLYDEKFVDKLKEIIEETKVNTKKIMFEFTEDVVINYKQSNKTIRRIKELGIQAGIDDFGTGYSSLSYFARLPVLFIKIAQDFIKNIGDKRSEKLIEVIVNLSQSFEMGTCAEGIETEEHLRFLQIHKCMLGQGFLFSKSLPEQFIFKNVNNIKSVIKDIVCKDKCLIYNKIPESNRSRFDYFKAK